jgi:hypothetical protein
MCRPRTTPFATLDEDVHLSAPVGDVGRKRADRGEVGDVAD